MRGIRDIRDATFAGLQIQVGSIQSNLYAKGLSTGNKKDGWWILLEERADGSYQARLPGGKRLVDRLLFATKDEGRLA